MCVVPGSIPGWALNCQHMRLFFISGQDEGQQLQSKKTLQEIVEAIRQIHTFESLFIIQIASFTYRGVIDHI